MANRKRSEYADKELIKRLDKVTILDSEETPSTPEVNKKTDIKNLSKKEIFDIDGNTTITESQGQMFFNSTKATGTHEFTLESTSLQVGDTIWIKKSGACDSIDVIEGSGVTITSIQSATEIGDLLTITKIASAVFSCVKIKSESGTNIFNSDGTITELTERIVEIEAGANIKFEGTRGITNIGDGGLESVSSTVGGEETRFENRNGVQSHVSDLGIPLKSDVYYAPTANEHYVQKQYSDAQDLKSANAEGLFIQVTTSDVGVTYTGASSRTLSIMPKFFSLKIVNTTLYTDASTINIGFGAKLLRDANGDAIGNDNAIQDRFYNCYYDDLTDTIRVLNFTNVNAVQVATISGNDYIVAKVFNRFPQELSVRWSAPNPTATPRIEISNGLAFPIMRDLVDQFGFTLNPNVFEVGRNYTLRFNSTTSKFEVQGVFKEVYCAAITTGTDLSSTESGRKLFQYNSASNGTITIGTGTLKNGGTMAFNCLAAGRLQVNVSGATLTDNLALNNVAQTFTIYRDESGIYYMN